jgi:hypothetical protein
MIELHVEKGLYGIKEEGILVVPCVWVEPMGAIDEWEYFELLNTDERQFLSHKRTHQEIEEIVNRLKNYETKT